jgi:hypothetical protein
VLKMKKERSIRIANRKDEKQIWWLKFILRRWKRERTNKITYGEK